LEDCLGTSLKQNPEMSSVSEEIAAAVKAMQINLLTQFMEKTAYKH